MKILLFALQILFHLAVSSLLTYNLCVSESLREMILISVLMGINLAGFLTLVEKDG